MIKKIIKKILRIDSEAQRYQKISFSQSGEDLVVKFIFHVIGMGKPTYLDIGAHHPFYLSNTALFYQSGSTGINIEPDPHLFKLFAKHRQRDVNLNIGVADKEAELDFYLINYPTLNTFSKAEAEKYQQEGNYFIKEVTKIKVQTIESILLQSGQKKFPDFLSLDAEGIDGLIIRSIDFKNNFPIVICIETLSFSDSGNGIKNIELIRFIESNNYKLYADTNINSIFVRKEYLNNRLISF